MTSDVDLWANLDPSYNENSIDFGTGGRYEYSQYDLRKRYELLTNPELASFANTVLNWEGAGKAQPIHIIEYNNQLRYKYGSTSSFNAAFDLGYFQSIIAFCSSTDPFTSLNYRPQTRLRTTIPLAPYSSTPVSNLPVNPWNRFLHLHKGVYSGKDWIRKASDDYRLWMN
jgi:hypothetical protein